MIPQSDTVWTKTPYANLYRYEPSGKYYVRAKVCGKLVRQSLKTKSLEIAQIKLADILKSERSRLSRKPTTQTLAAVMDAHEADLVATWKRKPSGLKYRQESLLYFRRAAVDLLPLSPARAVGLLPPVLATLRAKYSAPRYNGMLGALKPVWSAAVKAGLLAVAPEMPRAAVVVIQADMPSREQFKAFLRELDTHPRRREASLAVRFMAYTGCRMGALAKLKPEHIHLTGNYVLIPPLKFDTKPNRVPLIGEARSVCKRMLAMGTDPIFSSDSFRRAIRTCSKRAGFKLTPHGLRHLFATRCLESGVDVRTVAAWLGHKDGGALLLRRYAHLRDEHSQKMSKRVRF